MSIQLKKLSLDTVSRAVLFDAVASLRHVQPKDMRYIYDLTLASIDAASDRIMLTEEQTGIVKVALERWHETQGETPDTVRMLDQLTLSRKKYAEKYPE